MLFADLGLSSKVTETIEEIGYAEPTPIQVAAIPEILQGRDILGIAQTGTGKTASFTLPLLTKLEKGRARARMPRSLILCPTRELAAQVFENFEKYGKRQKLSVALLIGGMAFKDQERILDRGADVLIATPGRLMDHFERGKLMLTRVEYFVIDEADRMLDMGFIRDIKKIIAALPKQRQNLLFSATFSDDIRNLAKGLVHNPVEISVTPRNAAAKTVEQWVYPVDKAKKTSLLIKLIKDNDWQQVLVFSKTKHGANRITKQLEAKNISAAAIHGNKSQGARTKALANFKAGEVRVLVATDIAARGIDIDQLPHVINYELPHVSEDYVHRIGRTGRAGAEGEAMSLVCADEFKLLSDIERLIQKLIPRKNIEGFDLVNPLPESKLNTRPIRAKKPKKPKSDHRDGQRSGENAQGHRAGKPGGNQNRRPQRGAKPQGGKPSGNR